MSHPSRYTPERMLSVINSRRSHCVDNTCDDWRAVVTLIWVQSLKHKSLIFGDAQIPLQYQVPCRISREYTLCQKPSFIHPFWQNISCDGYTDRQHSTVISMSGCRFCVSIHKHISKTTCPNFTKFFVYVAYGHGLGLLLRCCIA